MRPHVDDLVVALLAGDEAAQVVVHDLLDLCVTLGHVLGLLLRDDDISEVEAQSTLEGHAVTEVLDVVEELCGTGHAAGLDDLADDSAQALLGDDLVDIANLLGYILVEEYAAHGGLLAHLHQFAIFVEVLDHDGDGSVECHLALVVGDLGLFGTVED